MLCKYCDAKGEFYDKTNHRSKSKADVYINAGRKTLTLYGNRKSFMFPIEIPIRYCPVCGRDLSAEPVQTTLKEYNELLKANLDREIKDSGLTIAELVKKTGIDEKTFLSYLKDDGVEIPAGKVAVIADALKLPLERLFLPHGERMTYEEALRAF